MKKLSMLIISILLSLTALSQSSGRTVCIGNSIFVAFCDLPEDIISKQLKSNWCWTACIQTILRFNDEDFKQSEIVENVYGGSYNWTASGNDIAEAFNGWHGWKAKSFKQKSIRILIDELLLHGPIIVGTEEHAYVLTHIYYTNDLSPSKVILINPKTAREEVRDWSDFFPAINTIISLWK
ncbi:MAG: hypothetical protein K2K97_07000 [Muribaculaceae bacterium]|nr:hypothetical protein [Muribaculaceae bacterium]